MREVTLQLSSRWPCAHALSRGASSPPLHQGRRIHRPWVLRGHWLKWAQGLADGISESCVPTVGASFYHTQAEAERGWLSSAWPQRLRETGAESSAGKCPPDDFRAVTAL